MAVVELVLHAGAALAEAQGVKVVHVILFLGRGEDGRAARVGAPGQVASAMKLVHRKVGRRDALPAVGAPRGRVIIGRRVCHFSDFG